MKKWEYIFVTFEGDSVAIDQLNTLGESGWELTCYLQDNKGFHCIFKRRKSNELDLGEPGRIMDMPSPEADRISKEEEKDLTLGGVLKKNSRDE